MLFAAIESLLTTAFAVLKTPAPAEEIHGAGIRTFEMEMKLADAAPPPVVAPQDEAAPEDEAAGDDVLPETAVPIPDALPVSPLVSGKIVPPDIAPMPQTDAGTAETFPVGAEVAPPKNRDAKLPLPEISGIPLQRLAVPGPLAPSTPPQPVERHDSSLPAFPPEAATTDRAPPASSGPGPAMPMTLAEVPAATVAAAAPATTQPSHPRPMTDDPAQAAPASAPASVQPAAPAQPISAGATPTVSTAPKPPPTEVATSQAQAVPVAGKASITPVDPRRMPRDAPAGDATGAAPQQVATDPRLTPEIVVHMPRETRAETTSQPAVVVPHALAEPRRVIRQVAERVAEAKHNRIEITLSPEELGKVRVVITPGDTPAVTIHAENRETLDLMRRNGDLLARELRDTGLGGATISFGDGGDEGSQMQHPERLRYAASRLPREEPDALPATAAPPRAPTGRQIDIRI